MKFLLLRGGAPGTLPVLVYLPATLLASVALFRSVGLPGRRRARARFGMWVRAVLTSLRARS